MKKLTVLPILALLCLASMTPASGQNLSASMAYSDQGAYSSLEFLDVSFPALEELPATEIMAANDLAEYAARPVISHSSAAVLSVLGLLCLTGRKR